MRGNTPAHLAAQGGRVDVLVALLQAQRPPDIDAANDAGVTVRALSQAAMGGDSGGGGGGGLAPGDGADAAAAAAGAAAADDDGGGGGDDGDFRQRLWEEMSDDEAGGVGWARCVYARGNGRHRQTPCFFSLS